MDTSIKSGINVTLSFQLQWTSDADQRLRWQAGMYFLNIERRVGVAQLEDDGRANLPRSFINELTDALVLDDFETTVLSGFGSIAYDLTDRMELSIALRYDVEDRESHQCRPEPSGRICINQYRLPQHLL